MPAPILTEVCYLLERERGAQAEAGFLRSVRDDVFTLVALTAADLDRMAELVETYADLPLGAADASVIAVAERLGVPASRPQGSASANGSAPATRVRSPATRSPSTPTPPAPGEPVWYGGGKLAPDLALPKLRHRWTPAATATSAGRFTAAERSAVYEHAARAAHDAAQQIRLHAATDPGAAADAAWAAADTLHAAARALDTTRDFSISIQQVLAEATAKAYPPESATTSRPSRGPAPPRQRGPTR